MTVWGKFWYISVVSGLFRSGPFCDSFWDRLGSVLGRCWDCCGTVLDRFGLSPAKGAKILKASFWPSPHRARFLKQILTLR